MLNRTAALVALTLAWLATALPAAADCEPAGALPEVLPTAEVAFVGRVVATTGPVASFAVEEIWAGDLGATVEVRGLSDEVGGPDVGFGAGFSEDDRRWTDGATYLVVPWIDGDVLRDHICTASTEWRADLEPLRPADARVMTASESRPAVPMPLLVVGAVVLLLTLASVLAFRRR